MNTSIMSSVVADIPMYQSCASSDGIQKDICVYMTEERMTERTERVTQVKSARKDVTSATSSTSHVLHGLSLSKIAWISRSTVSSAYAIGYLKDVS